ncbi:DMT family transporter [Mucilaginibacter segetis]|uniref:DMT family transporter n=1 Tax=Mucilaginibacter segetis TaxID=2793071 RepID=A0A934UNY1_9SPHI|nr:DMT family transporter [Mucilaginibacter segetis]MBK0381278.1 DMT family transporter [Mucilaginibacter segetis]
MNPKLSLIIGIICISFSPIFVKLADASPVMSAFYRILIGWLALVPYCVFSRKLAINRKDLLLTILGGIIFAADIAVWNMSLVITSATISTLIANLAPVWVGLLSFLIFRKRSGWMFWTGTIIAIGGMIILVGFQHIIHLQFNIGLIYALAASFLYSIYLLITSEVMKRVHTLTFMFYNMLAAAVVLFVVCVIQGHNFINFSVPTWLNFAGMGLICQLTGWITINFALKHIESTKVAVSLLSQTVVAGVLAAFLLNEHLSLQEGIGSLVVLAGIAFTFIKRRRGAVSL